ncbi:uncharacterized protein LOC111398255 [Olea europaea var. sylvestris]|uniref:uncharacterized protein LOC111398255 n=1 Tax=Olea europaea var. sylvestris TaxID=158386 RepID=UPI000C1D0C9A|nr:uncharacterized protein LOC111398255 [Olea europaea var. sylvestris]
MIGPNGEELEYSLRFEFPATNNDVEYETVITGLGLAAKLGVTSVEICSDSQLIVWFKITKVSQKDNEWADTLARLTSANPRHLPRTANVQILRQPSIQDVVDVVNVEHEESWMEPLIEYLMKDKLSEDAFTARRLTSANPRHLPRTANVKILRQPSIQDVVDVVNVEHEESWMEPLIEYLMKDKLSEDAFTARRLKAWAASFAIIDGLLYKRGFIISYLKCLWPTEAREVLVEIHTGICGNHQATTALAFKALRQGYYWPSMKEDTKELVRKYDACQRHGNLIHIPTKQQTWVEAEPLATITTTKVQGFVWKNIICRFGIPRVGITDNAKQFDNHSFRAFCTSYHIDHRLTSVAHPQSNGQAEVTNRTILWDLKTMLEKEKGLWANELPNPDVTAIRAELDLLKRARKRAAIRMLAYKRRAAEYFNRRVRSRVFQPGDLVLRDAAAVKHLPPKLGPNWEGPYEVIRSLEKGAYSLKDMKGKPLGRPWNAEYLKKYYQ